MYNLLIADADVDAWFHVNALLRRYLVKANFVSNLGVARRRIDKQLPSLLFIDKQLLDISASDFFQYVKANYPKLKIILVNRLGESARRLQAGADLVISKPIVPEIIEQVILGLAFQSAQEIPAANK
jgi:DNA-binding response OmpR family regulator